MGASIITGLGGGNPMAVIARQLKLKLHRLKSTCTLFGADGSQIDKPTDSRIESLFNEIMEGMELLFSNLFHLGYF